MPPSASTSLPVSNDAASEVMNEITFAISSGVPRRPRGLLLMMSCMIGWLDSSSRFIGVSLMPGDTDMTRAPTRTPGRRGAPNQPMHTALGHLVGEARDVEVEELPELVEEPGGQGIFEHREELGALRDHVSRLRCDTHPDRTGTEQGLGGAQDSSRSHEVHLEDPTPGRHRSRDPGGVDQRAEVFDLGEQRVDLRLVGHVARDGFDVASELGGDLLQTRGILVGDQERAACGELTSHRRSHPRGRSDHDVRHHTAPSFRSDNSGSPLRQVSAALAAPSWAHAISAARLRSTLSRGVSGTRVEREQRARHLVVRRGRHAARSSSAASSGAPAHTIPATGTLAQPVVGQPDHHRVDTSADRRATSSTSAGYTLNPPTMIFSCTRPVM